MKTVVIIKVVVMSKGYLCQTLAIKQTCHMIYEQESVRINISIIAL